MPITCPTCGTSNAVRCAVVYAAGTSDVDMTSHHSGFAGGGTYAGSSTTTGVSMSRAAASCAPPERIPWVGIALASPFVAAFFGFIAGAVAHDGLHYSNGFSLVIAYGLGVLIEALLVAISVRAWRYNRLVWPGLMESWQRTWMCGACGHQFVVPAGGPVT